MEITLHKINWQNEYISKKHIISLLSSCAIIILVLFIPINPKQFETTEKHLKVTLWKENLQEHQSQIEKTLNNPKIEPLIHQKILPKVTKKLNNIIKTNKKVRKINELALVKPIQEKKKMPNALDISKWIKNYQSLEEVGMDFQTKNDKFIYKNIIIPKQNKLVVENKLAKNLNVDNPDSLLVSATKKSIGFFSALDEPEKTVDSIPYCALWGRRSFHCPGKSL